MIESRNKKQNIMNLVPLQSKNKIKQFQQNVWNPKKQAAQDAIKHQFVNNGRPVPVRTQTTEKYPLYCCGQCMISANNDTSIFELEYQIERLKIESKLQFDVRTRSSGEKCIIINCIMPYEEKLRDNLISLGFKHVNTSARRTGYKPGEIQMFILNI